MNGQKPPIEVKEKTKIRAKTQMIVLLIVILGIGAIALFALYPRTPAVDSGVTTCGNGKCDSGENCSTCPADCKCSSSQLCCKGACKAPACTAHADCNDGNTCTVDTCNNAGTCNAACSSKPITACINGDGCCPTGCTSANDNDCVPGTCGNTKCDLGETCGNCPADCLCGAGTICCAGVCKDPTCLSDQDCDDGNACTTDTCNNVGTCNAACSNKPITACINRDGCCPAGCTSFNDNDCAPSTCGNTKCDLGETCGNCPADCLCGAGTICCTGACVNPACLSDQDCNDGNSNTTDKCVNPGTCNAACTNT